MTAAPIRIAALGDIMLDRAVGRHFAEQPADFRFTELADRLAGCDLVLANLENPVALTGQPHPKQDPQVAFRAHPHTLQVLRNLGVDAVTIANNHLLDYGPTALVEATRHLDEYGIRYLGAGKNYAEANRPLLLELKGRKLAILASVMIFSASTERATRHSPGVADYNARKLIRNVRRYRSQGYQVVVTLHWGIEYCFYPIPYQRRQAQAMIDAGASLILGHGPHYPQGIEMYRGGEIVHSLGNFIFDEPYLFARKSFIYMADLTADGNVAKREILPVILDRHCPRLDPMTTTRRTETIVARFGEIYQRKSGRFWKTINNLWFTDIVKRVTKMRSWKFIRLPPLSFYFSIGFNNFFRKLTLNNFSWALGHLKKHLVVGDRT